MQATLDHLVFGTASLDDGVAWLESRLGVPLQQGGEHAKMGTHNRLLRLGERTYLELIAINPDASLSKQLRWFGLNDPAMQASLATPRLLTFVAQTGDVQRVARESPITPGPVHTMNRNALNWLSTIPNDGALVEGGTFPAFIQWLGKGHPASGLPSRGIALNALEIGTPEPERITRALTAVGFDFAASKVSVVENERGPRLTACLSTPNGVVRFDSLPSAENRIVAASEPGSGNVRET